MTSRVSRTANRGGGGSFLGLPPASPGLHCFLHPVSCVLKSRCNRRIREDDTVAVKSINMWREPCRGTFSAGARGRSATLGA